MSAEELVRLLRIMAEDPSRFSTDTIRLVISMAAEAIHKTLPPPAEGPPETACEEQRSLYDHPEVW